MDGRHGNADSIAVAMARARECARDPVAALAAPVETAAVQAAGRRRFAIGDPQAPLEKFLSILAGRGLLDEAGRIPTGVSLLSLGDHFDWGASDERVESAQSGLQLLAWLAAHPADQVLLVAGNHDLGRIGELAAFDDETFAEAHAAAVLAYRNGDPDPALEAEFLARYPALPTAEVAARDFAAFAARQRDLVAELLRSRRLRVGVALSRNVLASHAGVTIDDLDAIGMPAGARARAAEIAAALDAALDAALAAWDGGPLAIPHLHRPGDRDYGEGRGIFYHRPQNPDLPVEPELLRGPLRRRFDPRRLPLGLVQIVGHISDKKCRQLLGPWASPEPTPPGGLRHLSSDGVSVRYVPGLPQSWDGSTALMIFTDGRMNHVAAEHYELLDIDRLLDRLSDRLSDRPGAS